MKVRPRREMEESLDMMVDVVQEEEAVAEQRQATANERLVATDDDHDRDIEHSNQAQHNHISSRRGRRRKSIIANSSSLISSQLDHKNPLELLVFNFLLPFILMFLLPSIKLAPNVDQNVANEGRLVDTNTHQLQQTTAELLSLENLLAGTTSDLLIALVRLPIDRLQIESSLIGRLVSAKELSVNRQQSDLQEEETHMMLLAPAEHRASYMHPHGGGGGGGGASAYGGPPPDMQVGGAHDGQPAEYGPAGAESDLPAAAAAAAGGGVPTVSGVEAAAAPTTAAAEATRSSALQSRNDLPAVRALNVKCEKNHMTVNIVFDRPFFGMVFSKGHYNDQKCVHLPPNSGQTSVNFDIHLGKCGMSSSEPSQQQHQTGLQQGQNGQQQQQPNGLYIENTIIIQYDPLVQEIYDQARKLRCTWYDYYEKSVAFRPYNVDMLDAVTANFLGDNIQCWMQIQVGKGPWSSEVAGIVKIGQTMTMVLAIKDDDNKFDMLVRSCYASDGKHPPIQLVDEYGCVARPKIMAKFQKVRNFGSSANVVSYAHFQAFKFPDSMSVHFQCIIQVCRFECPEPVCQQSAGGGELGGAGNGGAGQSGPQGGGDYATSGTEMVASKELPGGGLSAFTANNSAPSSISQSQRAPPPPPSALLAHQHHSNAIQLKLDESQGRVQVKLDTSMMAGGANRAPGNQQGGPLPPHLLHMQPAVGSGAIYPQQGQARPGSGGGSSAATRQQSPAASGPRLMAQQMAPSGTGQSSHGGGLQFSHPYNSMGRRSSAAFASRLGELSGGDDDEDQQAASTSRLTNQAPYETAELLVNPLSLLAAPRGLRFGSPVSSSASTKFDEIAVGNQLNHRFKRQTLGGQAALNSTRRSGRSPSSGADSTAVKTQKTIQVVSPDDVAFSLMSDDDDDDQEQNQGNQKQQFNFGQSIDYFANNNNKPKTTTSKRQQQQQQQLKSPTVCFSTARFLLGLLVTLGSLASSIVVVTFVILKQRSKLNQKLSSVFECPPQVAAADESHHHHHRSHQQREEEDQSRAAAALELLLARQRQREEIQQRNNYLARLYSQFSPAAYWSSSSPAR